MPIEGESQDEKLPVEQESFEGMFEQTNAKYARELQAALLLLPEHLERYKELATLIDQQVEEVTKIASALKNGEVSEGGWMKARTLLKTMRFEKSDLEFVALRLALEKKDPEEKQALVIQVLQTLTYQERQICSHVLGLEDHAQKPLSSVASELQMSEGEAQRIFSKAVRKLQHPVRSRQLPQAFLDQLATLS